MNWGAFDLNLLIVFDAVMQERNVTRAGSKIGLSQPAVSHALSRLRYMLKDELFIRTPDGMAPTPRAEQLAGPLRRALSDMQLALEPETFVPQEATRLFVLALNNYAAVILAPSLVTAVISRHREYGWIYARPACGTCRPCWIAASLISRSAPLTMSGSVSRSPRFSKIRSSSLCGATIRPLSASLRSRRSPACHISKSRRAAKIRALSISGSAREVWPGT